MSYEIKIEDKTSGTLNTTTFGDFSTIALAKARIDTTVTAKSSTLPYNLELEQSRKLDGYNSSNVLRRRAFREYFYVRSDNKNHVYTAIIVDTDYPNYNRS